jgi:hypothetical protein
VFCFWNLGAFPALPGASGISALLVVPVITGTTTLPRTAQETQAKAVMRIRRPLTKYKNTGKFQL